MRRFASTPRHPCPGTLLRERQYIQMASPSGMNSMEIIFQDILPNLIPYIAATLVLSVSSGILAAIGLEVLGLGPSHLPSLGMLIFWAQFYMPSSAASGGGSCPRIAVLLLIFVGLFLISMGLDQISNPRLRQQ
ncbi:MAG: ABC transporter permease subunit [Caldilineaceae bacterium]